jgi:hypothetical protein
MTAITTLTPSILGNQTQYINYLINQSLIGINTTFPAKIIAINGLTATIETIINQVALNQPAPTPITVNNIPIAQLFGGNAGIIIEYQVGDIVLCGVVQRDISSIKKNWDKANPPSNRLFNYADSIILFKMANQLPTTYVKITNSGIEIETNNNPITINASKCDITTSGDTKIEADNVNINATNTATIQAVTANIEATNVNLGESATHSVLLENIPMIATISGVEPGGGVTGATITVSLGGSTTVKASI